MTVLYTPLDIPKIVPTNWDQWWDAWSNATTLSKIKNTHNPKDGADDLWRGVTLYKGSVGNMVYDCPDVSMTAVAKNITEQVFTYIPMKIMCIRVIENLKSIDFHTDHAYSKQQLRSILWSDYEQPVWNFKYKDEVKKFKLPQESNTFYYVDNPLEHSAVYDNTKTKGLLWIYGYLSMDSNMAEFAENSAAKFKEQSWVI